GENCGHVIPSCIGCDIADAVLKQPYLCHAVIEGCSPTFKSIEKKSNLAWPVTNESRCFVDKPQYNSCTMGLRDSRHTLFPMYIVFGLLLTIIAFCALRVCHCYSFKCNNEDCFCCE